MKLFRKMRNSNSSKGFSLLEMMLAISLFSILLLISVESFWRAEQALKDQDHVISRMRLIHSLINIFGMPSSMRAAVENNGENSFLWKCVHGYTCLPGGPRDISLYLPPLYSDGSSVTTSGAVSGPPGSPILYNLDGQACDPAAQTCTPDDFPIAVTTQYSVVCPPEYDLHAHGNPTWSQPVYPTGIVPVTVGDCQLAHYFRIFYTVEPAAGAPASAMFPPVTGSIMVNARAVGFSR